MKNICKGCVNIKICPKDFKKLSNTVGGCTQRNRADDQVIILKKPRLVLESVEFHLKMMRPDKDDIMCITMETVKGSPSEWLKNKFLSHSDAGGGK